MALGDSNLAIGAVTRLINDHMMRRTKLTVTATHPREASAADDNPKLNFFLYELQFDASLKNHSLQEGQPPPLWLVLKYVLTAYDKDGHSDTADAHELIGRGLAALQEVNFLRLDAQVDALVLKALENNPEALKLTFDEAPADLISKLMQGPDETYRFSVAFQVRPVMIVPAETPSYNLLVGVNYETTPETIIGQEGVQLEILPSLGPVLEKVSPPIFDADPVDASAPEIELTGNDLHLSGLECVLGSTVLPITAQQPNRIVARVGSVIASGAVISAGEHPLFVRQLLKSGRYRSSNLLTGRLRPALTSITPTVVVDAGPPITVTGSLALTGHLLGADVDDIQVAFYRGGQVVRVVDVAAPASNQTALTVTLPTVKLLAAGLYRIIFRVNGQQARNSPPVNLS